jgi:transcriptional regulator with XRE-family HTH domain
MKSVGPRLKAVRERAQPRLSIRKIAEALDIPASSYAFYESPTSYKKPSLPLDFTRRVATVLSQYGVDPADVMALAGLTGEEAAPEAEVIASRAPPIQFVQMAVAMPSAAALTQMFDALLRGFDEGLPRAELAQGLAQRLPVALAQLQGPLIEMDEEPATLPSDAAPPPAKARRAPPSQPSK